MSLIGAFMKTLAPPKIIANTKAKYFKGVTRETSACLYDKLSHKFATPPKIPINDKNIKS